MKFKTASGTEYILTDIETEINATGEPCPPVGPQGIPVILSYTGTLSRVGKPLFDMSSGGSFQTNEESHRIEFNHLPEIGVRFTYYHPVWAGCYSTIVTVIEEDHV